LSPSRLIHATRALGLALLAGLILPLTSFSADAKVQLQRTGDSIDVRIDGRPFTTYYFVSDVAKPYFQPLRSAQGTIVTRDFPIGNTIPPGHEHDDSLEPHQRPMFFGHGDIDGIDFWGEAVFPHYSDDTVFGRTVFHKIEEMRSGQSGALKADFALTSPEGRVIADEVQSYAFGGDSETRWIDCEITLLANHGSDLTLGDTKEGSFGIRLAKELNSPPGRMVNSAGAEGEKAIWGKRADWVDYDGTIAGEGLGVALFDSPRSFRHPTWWHARGYGLLAANPFGWREFYKDPDKDGSWTIPQGKKLTFRYRVFIHHGDYQQARVAEAYQAYVAHEQ
jgi:Methane oxygenase PmoA